VRLRWLVSGIFFCRCLPVKLEVKKLIIYHTMSISEEKQSQAAQPATSGPASSQPAKPAQPATSGPASSQPAKPAQQHHDVIPKSHHLYKVIMRSGIAEVLTNYNDEKTQPIIMSAKNVLMSAVKSNDVEYAKEVVSKATSKDIELAMQDAVLQGNLEMVKLLHPLHPLHPYDFSVLLRSAYRSRNAEMQNYILQLAKDGFDDSAFKESFAHGILMMNIHDFKVSGNPYYIYSDAIWSTDKDIIASALKFLYGDDVSKISHDAKRMLLKEACFTNDIEIIKRVVNECKIESWCINLIFYDISMFINNTTLTFLLNYINFNEIRFLGFGIENILLFRSLDMVKTVMRNFDIAPCYRAVNREEIFNEIKDRLNEHERTVVEFQVASRLGRYDDINRLIDKIGCTWASGALRLACESGCIKTVKRIFWRIYNHDEDSPFLTDLLCLGNEEMVLFAIDQIRNQMRCLAVPLVKID
jgi:hypothetical protein